MAVVERCLNVAKITKYLLCIGNSVVGAPERSRARPLAPNKGGFGFAIETERNLSIVHYLFQLTVRSNRTTCSSVRNYSALFGSFRFCRPSR